MDMISQYPQYLSAQKIDPIQVIFLSIVFLFMCVLVVSLVTEGLSLFLGCRMWLQAGSIGILSVPLSLLAFKQIGFFNWELLFGLVGLTTLGLIIIYGKSKTIRSFLTFLSMSIAIVPLVFLMHPAFQTFGKAELLKMEKIQSKVPIVLVVFDELRLKSLLDRDGNIDRRLFPNFARLADHSVWFKNTQTVAEQTKYAVPAILSGLYPKTSVNRTPELSFVDNQNLFSLFKQTHRLNVFESTTGLCKGCPRRLNNIHYIPGFLADTVILYGNLILPRELAIHWPGVGMAWKNFAGANRSSVDPGLEFSAFLKGLDKAAYPSFNFIHLQIPHMPWVNFPSGRRYVSESDMGVFFRKRKTRKTLSLPDTMSSDENLLTVAYQRYMLQVGYADTLLGKLLERLKKTGLYEQSLLVILSDHGTSFYPGQPRRIVTKLNFDEILPVPFFIKSPGQRHGVQSERKALTIDLVPTISDILDIELPWVVDGLSLWDRQRKLPVTKATGSISSERFPIQGLNLFNLSTGCFSDVDRPVNSDGAFAVLDLINRGKDEIEFVGWAIDRENMRPAKEIVIFADERMVFRGPTGFPRSDLANHFGVSELKLSGYHSRVKNHLFHDVSRVRIFALVDRYITEVRYPVDFPWSSGPGLPIENSCLPPTCGNSQAPREVDFLITKRCNPEKSFLESPFVSFSERLLELSQGATDDGIFRYQPYQSLIGQSLNFLDISIDSGLKIEIENQFLFEEIDPHSEFLPAIVKGVLYSVENIEFVAVALNERILNVMPTWVDSKGIHHFQVILPEQALRAGKNEIKVLAVVKESGSVSLKKEISLGK